MATQTFPALTAEQSAVNGSLAQSKQALVALRPTEAEQIHSSISLHGPIALLPVELDVAVPVREFRVRNLLALECGQVIETEWGYGDDIPLASGEEQIAWSEFEVVDSQLGVRVTRLV